MLTVYDRLFAVTLHSVITDCASRGEWKNRRMEVKNLEEKFFYLTSLLFFSSSILFREAQP
jgi:hypothetical protein